MRSALVVLGSMLFVPLVHADGVGTSVGFDYACLDYALVTITTPSATVYLSWPHPQYWTGGIGDVYLESNHEVGLQHARFDTLGATDPYCDVASGPPDTFVY
jgi:hypothetical protein